MASDRFPGPYRNSVAQNVDSPDPMIERVPFSHTDIGARKSVVNRGLREGPKSISHVPNMNSK